jgi:glycosyltransferase involved in cell wall biosynthesis
VRICMVASTYPRFDRDGSGRFNRSLAEALAAGGHEVHVLVPYDSSMRPYPTAVHIHPFRYIWPDRWSVMGYGQAMESDRRLRLWAYLLLPLFLSFGTLALWRLVRRQRFDVLHAHWVVPNGPMARVVSIWTGLPLFVTLHGSDIWVSLGNRWFGHVARWVLRGTKAVTACSPELLQGALTLGTPEERAHLFPWGADPITFAEKGEPEDLRRELGLSRDAAVILALGRLVGKKGFDVLVRAMPAVAAAHPYVRCLIVGSGPEEASLKRLIKELGLEARVWLPGAVPWDSVPEYLGLSELVVVPSVHDAGNVDGLPGVVQEAMAAERAVVASDVAGIPLAVTHGVTGLLVPEGDPAALATAICRLLDAPDLRRRLGKAGRERVEREMNWQSVASRLVEMYRVAGVNGEQIG